MNRWISVIAGVVIATAITILLIIGPRVGSVENLREVLVDYGPWAVAISVGLMIGQAILAPLPGNVVTITNALVFGPLWGSLLSWASMILGACLCFLLSKTFGKPFAQKIVGTSIHKAEDFFRKYGLQAVFLVRMMPFVPFDAVSFGAPLVGVPFRRFLFATAIGIIPSILVYSYLGIVIASVYWWVLVGLLTIALIAVLVARRMFRSQPGTQKAQNAEAC
jgi:uncharacterized membrane protein YdjX (TVP38/TMEM64 family)